MKKIATVIFFLTFILTGSSVSFAQVSVSIEIAPQPPCPVDGYLWTPGYWGYGRGGYYWIPGVWLLPAEVGFLWTPGYWGFGEGYYHWHGGYWGNHVGYYGGVHYGHGYDGDGYYGGRWEGRNFRYNTAVSNVNRRSVHNTYEDRSVVNSRKPGGSSFNGPRGASARPTAGHQAAAGERHASPTRVQQYHENAASRDVNKRAAVNNGRPAFSGRSNSGGQQSFRSAPSRQQPSHQQSSHGGGGGGRHR
jgi:hypothetical protein